MRAFVKKHKICIGFIVADLLLYWILCGSGFVLPFINPSASEYREMLRRGASAPRNTMQMMIWYVLHFPTSLFISGMASSDRVQFLSVLQTGAIVCIVEERIQKRKGRRDDLQI